MKTLEIIAFVSLIYFFCGFLVFLSIGELNPINVGTGAALHKLQLLDHDLDKKAVKLKWWFEFITKSLLFSGSVGAVSLFAIVYYI